MSNALCRASHPLLQINKGIRDYYTIALFHYYAQDTLKKIVYIQDPPCLSQERILRHYYIITLLHKYDTYILPNQLPPFSCLK